MKYNKNEPPVNKAMTDILNLIMSDKFYKAKVLERGI